MTLSSRLDRIMAQSNPAGPGSLDSFISAGLDSLIVGMKGGTEREQRFRRVRLNVLTVSQSQVGKAKDTASRQQARTRPLYCVTCHLMAVVLL